MKGFVHIVEAILVIIILFVVFSILFPGFTYKSRWSEALYMSEARDLIITSDRTEKLYNFSFDSKKLQNFLDTLIPTNETGIISWSEIEGTIKNRIIIACNCTDEQMEKLRSWLDGLKINDRDIEFIILYTDIDVINQPPIIGSDVLLIWGYEDLTDYENQLKYYLKGENGVVEIMDLNKSVLDDVQRKIFGIGEAITDDTTRLSDYDIFRESPCDGKPCNTSDIIYQTWKYFYHIPIPLFTLSLPSGEPPVDDSDISQYCNQLSNGSLRIQAYVIEEGVEEPYAYSFWTCDSEKVYFDTDWNGSADIVVYEGESFDLPNLHNKSENFTFFLNYIGGEKIGVSFKPRYKFHDFIKYEWGYEIVKPGKGPPEHAVAAGLKNRWARYHVLAPGDGDLKRILIQAENKTDLGEPIPGVILNATSISRVAWISDFIEEGVGDDERLLLISLLLWASNKRAIGILSPEVKLGYKTSYVNTVNKDMFEVYKFSLGLGHPFE